jgi:predicted component of type VI protein secretion system
MFRTVVVMLLAMGLLTACGSSESAPRVLELEVTGTATLTSLTFTLDGQASEEKQVKLPWRKTVSVQTGDRQHDWELAMRHSGGDLYATAKVDGKLLTQTAGSGSPGSDNTANLSGSFKE